MAKKTRLEKLANTIVLLPLSEDRAGKYLSYCSYVNHSGVMGERKARKCKDRGCNHYIKLR